MSAFPLFRSPDTVGVYDPTNRAVTLPFDFIGLLPRFIEPKEANWRDFLTAFHEWAHFYQFASTTYGFYYHYLTALQLYLVNGFLRVFEGDLAKLELPLTTLGDGISMSSLPSSPLWHVHLRLISLLERLRTAVYGYSPFDFTLTEASPKGFGELEVFSKVVEQMMGWPGIAIGRIPNFTYRSGNHRYRIDDLLESHAHALGALWFAEAARDVGLPPSLLQSVQDHFNENAIGPYGAFLRLVGNYKIDNRYKIATFCTMCDLALNPLVLHDLDGDINRVSFIPDFNWNPVERLYTSFQQAGTGELPLPDVQSATWEKDYLEKRKAKLGFDDVTSIPFRGSSRKRLALLLEKAQSIGDAPEELTHLWLDALGIYVAAEELREIRPFPLAGGRSSLSMLTKTLGGPSVVCKFGTGSKFYPRLAWGLVTLGLLEPANVGRWVSHRTTTGLSISLALQKFLYMDKVALRRCTEERPYGEESLSFNEVLRKFYGHSPKWG
jgi:hypothetical protein